MGKRKEEYKKVIKGGLFYELYPYLTGNYFHDRRDWKSIYKTRLKEAQEVKCDVPKQVDIVSTDETIKERVYSLGEEEKEFLLSYIRTNSPSGCEYEAQEVWTKYLKGHVDSYTSDPHGNVVAKIGAKLGLSRFDLMIEAHCDEISYIITKIEQNGLISVIRNGGSDESIAPSKKVIIHVSNTKKLQAVFGWIAIHIRERDVNPNPKNIFLDAGFDSYDSVIKAGIEVGQYVTYDEEPLILNDKLIGKSLDNKVGGFIIAEVMKKLNKESLTINVLASNSVQEEVGLRGAEMVANSWKPDVVIVTDVCHDTSTPGINNKLIGDITLGKGPVLVRGAAINERLNTISEKAGKEGFIPYQVMACSGRGTGTDADAFTYSNGGTPTMLIKMPLRYMHTTVEMCSIKDIILAIDLMYSTVMEIDKTQGVPFIIPNKFSN